MKRDIVTRALSAAAVATLSFLTSCGMMSPKVQPPSPVAKTVVQTMIYCPKAKDYSEEFYRGLHNDVADMNNKFPYALKFMMDYTNQRDVLKACRTAQKSTQID